MKRRLERKRNGIARLAWVGLALVAVVILPLLLLFAVSAPKLAGGLVMAAMVPAWLPRRMEDRDGGGGGGDGDGLAGTMEKTARAIESMSDRLSKQEREITRLKEEANGLRTLTNSRKQFTPVVATTGPTSKGWVSDDAAHMIGCHFVVHCAASGKLEMLSSSSVQRDSLFGMAKAALGLTTRDAMTTTEIPLPAQYGSEIRELISQFGIVRNQMFPYPIGLGTAKPARMGTRPAFGSIAMSAPFPELKPTMDFASLESHKLGGIVRLPRELDEQSMVPLGRYLARYGAIEFARAEDTWGFLADGSPDYEGVKGVCTIANEQGKIVTLEAGKTKPSDAALANFRELRRKVNKAALNGRISAYYMDSTWETALSDFNTQAEPYIYKRLPDGSAILDGYPIIWTDVLEAYGTVAAASKNIVVFGALSFWWFGEHGAPRIDRSEHVWFANDQLAVRFIEEIDFDYCASDAVAVLRTAAA